MKSALYLRLVQTFILHKVYGILDLFVVCLLKMTPVDLELSSILFRVVETLANLYVLSKPQSDTMTL